MKRFLILVWIGLSTLHLTGQVLFFQDFESGTLDPMFAVDVDKKTLNPSVTSIAGPTFQVVQQSDKNKAAVNSSWFSPVGQADDWLISPPIVIPDSNTFLSWRAFTPDASFRDGYQVRISTTDTAIASFTTLVLNISAELTSWTSRSINLSSYKGDTIYFAFRNNSNDKYFLYLDDIRVEVLKNNNVRIRNLIVEKYNLAGTEVPIKITVENYGAQTLTSFLFTYQIEGKDYVDSITNINLAPYKSTSVTHSMSYPVIKTGEFPLEVNLKFPNEQVDADSTDNSMTRRIYGVSEPVTKKVLVEESCGTWCMWCPRGLVYTKLMADKYPGVVMPVHIHNYDPMTISEYDVPMSASVSGYPSGHIDRKYLDIDPLDFEAAIIELKERIVPVELHTIVQWDPTHRIANITGIGRLTIPTRANSLRFACIITEDDVRGTDPGYDQINVYSGGIAGAMGGYEFLPNPVPADQMVYNFVARALLGGFEGIENSVPDVLDANEEFQIEFNYAVSDKVDETNLHAIIIVLDEETGEILNGDRAGFTLNTAIPVLIPAWSSLFPNPTNDVLNLNVEYKTDAKVTMKIYTTMGQLVRDLGNLDLTQGNQTTQIRVADLSSGNYILELRNNNSVTALPFTKM